MSEEQFLEIKIRTAADLAGLKETGEAVAAVGEQAAATETKIAEAAATAEAALEATATAARKAAIIDSTAPGPRRESLGGYRGGDVNWAALGAQRAEAEKAVAVGAEEVAAAEAKAAIEMEKQLVVATRRAMLEATIAGDGTELQKLRAELAVRQNTIQTLQTEEMTQAQINALLEEQNVLIRQAAEGIAAKAAAEEAEAAAQAESSASKVYGPRNKYGRMLQNFGIDSNLIATASIGLMLGMQAKNLIDQQTESMERESAEIVKQVKEQRDQERVLRDQISNARTLEEMAAARTKVEETINGLWEQRATASEHGQKLIDSQIGHLTPMLKLTDNLSDAAKNRVTEEEKLKKVLDDQEKTYQKQIGDMEEQRRIRKEDADFQNKLREIEHKNKLEEIKAREEAGEITHEKAAQLRNTANESLDQDKFVSAQGNLQKDIAGFEQTKTKAQAVVQAAEAALEELQKKQQASYDAKAANDRKAQEAAKADAAAAEARKHAEDLSRQAGQAATMGIMGGVSVADSDASSKRAVEAEAAAKSAHAQAQDPEKLQKAFDEATKEAADAKEALAKLQTQSFKDIEAAEKGRAESEKKLQQSEALYNAEQTGRGYQAKAALQTGEKHDKTEQAREAEKARREAEKAEKEREAREKREAPVVAEGKSVAAAAASAASGNFSQDAKVRELAAALAKDPLNERVAQMMEGLVSQMMTHMVATNQKQNEALTQTEARLKRLIEDQARLLQQQAKNNRS